MEFNEKVKFNFLTHVISWSVSGRQNKLLTEKYSIVTFTLHARHVLFFNRGIELDFPFINIRKVAREVLKTKGEARGFQPSRGTEGHQC